jgi:uncharacterized protein
MNKTLITIVAGMVLAFRALGAIPQTPTDELFHDLAGIVDETDEQTIRNLQQDVLQRSGVPIVIVTVRRMADYLPGATDIEPFARSWFDRWRIGGDDNRGMLVLVSAENRKSRIHLGSAWGRRFDGFCKSLMNTGMVPRFKEGDYAAGLTSAVEALAEIAAAGPNSKPPERGIREQIDEALPLLANPRFRMVLGALGVLCLVLALRGRKNRRSWLTVSSLALGVALLSGLMLPLLIGWIVFGPALEFFGLSVGGGMWDRLSGSRGSDDRHSWGGGSSGGGGDSGGGASGDW